MSIQDKPWVNHFPDFPRTFWPAFTRRITISSPRNKVSLQFTSSTVGSSVVILGSLRPVGRHTLHINHYSGCLGILRVRIKAYMIYPQIPRNKQFNCTHSTNCCRSAMFCGSLTDSPSSAVTSASAFLMMYPNLYFQNIFSEGQVHVVGPCCTVYCCLLPGLNLKIHIWLQANPNQIGPPQKFTYPLVNVLHNNGQSPCYYIMGKSTTLVLWPFSIASC